MDTYEATNILLSKIKNFEPENASKIMGYILIQDLSDKDLFSLAFGSETLLQNVIIKAKTHLGLSTNTLSTPSSPSPSLLNPISRPSNSNHFSQSGRRVSSFVDFAKNPSPHSWPAPCSGFSHSSNSPVSISPKSSPFLSYDNIRSGSALVPPFSKNGGNGSGDGGNNNGDLLNEYQLDEYFSFLDDLSPKHEEFLDPRVQLGGYSLNNVDNHLHRRRFSESDACFGTEDGGFGIGYRPCMYFARGFCKNGDSCKFVHGGFGSDNIAEVGGGGIIMDSPREMEGMYLQQHEEMMRMKAAQHQQRLAYNKYMNFLLQQENDSPRMGPASVLMGDDIHKFGQLRMERNDLLAMAMEEKANSASRQIYLTFPADSSFKDEDVSNYFSTFGPVQDVRIPYQQKRMFGFVTFIHSETVKLILSRGNPHFICDSRVLVKPYKEKGKVANNRRQHLQQQLMDRGNFSPCSSPSGLDPRELYDLHLGARMLYNTQEMMLRRKLEQQAELQQAIELQGRRLINLQLPDLRGDFVQHHHRSLSAGAPLSMSPHSPVEMNLNLTSSVKNQDVLEVEGNRSAANATSTVAVAEENLQPDVNATVIQCNGTIKGDEDIEGCDANERGATITEHGLPDSPFASPAKKPGKQDETSPPMVGVKESTEFCGKSSSQISASMPETSNGDMASL